MQINNTISDFIQSKTYFNNTPYLYNFSSKNLVKNPSGHDQFQNWIIIEEGFEIESPPIGIEPIPANDPHFNDLKDAAFVTSYDWSSMVQKIDLWEIGLTPAVMRSILPFQFSLSVVVGSRVECGGKYKIQAYLQTLSGEKCLNEVILKGARAKGDGWAQVKTVLTINPSQKDKLDDIRYFVVANKGKDDRFWEGEYEIKFSRICVTFQCMLPVPSETEPKSLKTIRSLEFKANYKDRINNGLEEQTNKQLLVSYSNKDKGKKSWNPVSSFKKKLSEK